MLETGVLDNVDAIFGLHISANYPIGAVATRLGPILAASGFFKAVISGKGGHAALPHHTIDPILAASNVIVSLQHLVSREADPLDSQVLSLCFSHTHARACTHTRAQTHQHSLAGLRVLLISNMQNLENTYFSIF